MSRPAIRLKWRPPLALVVGGALIGVLALPTVGLMVERALAPTMGWDRAVLLTGTGILIGTAILGFLLWRLLVRPVRALAARASAVRRGESAGLRPLDHYGTSELRDLGAAVLGMGQALQDRELTLRSYTDHITHEMKSPLTAIRGAAELLAQPDLAAQDRAALVGQIADASARMQHLLDDQRRLTRAREPLPSGETRLSGIVPEIASEHPTLDIRLTRDATVPMGREGVSMILTQLLGNAAAHGATQVVVAGDARSLRFSDDGPGVSDGNRSRIFEPGFTTRREAGGTGMGLAILRQMLAAQGAEIVLDRTDTGASFLITF